MTAWEIGLGVFCALVAFEICKALFGLTVAAIFAAMKYRSTKARRINR